MKYPQVLRLRDSDEFTVVVPCVDLWQSKSAQKYRGQLLTDIKKAILDAVSNLPSKYREKFFAEELSKRAFEREGKPHYEFHVRLTSYPERHMLQKPDLPESLLNHFMSGGGNGFYVEMLEWQLRKDVLIKLKYLPFVEVHMTRATDAPFLDDSIRFP